MAAANPVALALIVPGAVHPEVELGVAVIVVGPAKSDAVDSTNLRERSVFAKSTDPFNVAEVVTTDVAADVVTAGVAAVSVVVISAIVLLPSAEVKVPPPNCASVATSSVACWLSRSANTDDNNCPAASSLTMNSSAVIPRQAVVPL